MLTRRIVINSRKRRNPRTRQGSVLDPSSSQHASLFEEKEKPRGGKDQKPAKLPRHVTRELEAQKTKDVLQGYQRVQDLNSRMLAGEEVAVNEWLLEAEKLVETFRETRRLFLSTRVRFMSFCSQRSKSDEFFGSCKVFEECFGEPERRKRTSRMQMIWRLVCNLISVSLSIASSSVY